MPQEIDDCVESVLEDNPDYTEARAYAICHAQQNEGNLSADTSPEDVGRLAEKHDLQAECAMSLANGGKIQMEDPCWENYTQVGTKTVDGEEVPNCVPDDDVPDAEGYENRALATRTLAIGPIEREESGSEVRYRNMALIGEGVWTDQASKTATLYDSDTLRNIKAEYDSSEYNGPPVNIAHDLSRTGKPNEASVGGFVDPRSLTAEDGKLYGDIVLDTSTAAGEYADENLQSALESGGRVGFGGPSVELDVPREHLTPAPNHPRAEEKVEQAHLTGTGLVMDPASENVSIDRETATRGVALSKGDKKPTIQKRMMNVNDLRGDLEQYNIDTSDMTDEDVMEFAEGLHNDLMDTLGEMEDMEMEEHGDDMEDDEDEDDEEDENMGDYEMADMEEMMAELEDMRERLSNLEAEMGNTASMSDVEQAKAELAAAETVDEVESELKNLSETVDEIASEPKQTKTMAEDTFNPEYDVSPSPDSTW